MITFIWGEHRMLSTWGGLFTRGLTTWCSPHRCFVEDNKIIFVIEKTITKKSVFSTHFRLLGVVDHVTTYCLPLHYIRLGCPPGCLLRRQIFCKTSKLSYYFYIVNKYVRYNNVYYPLVAPFDIFCQQEVNWIYNY